MKKKISMALVAGGLVVASIGTTVTYAGTNHSSQKQTTHETTWKYKGVTIHNYGNHELSQNEKANLEAFVSSLSNKSTSTSGSIQPNYIPAPDDPGTTIDGPAYRTYDNTVTNTIMRLAIDAVSGTLARAMGASPYGAMASAAAADWLSNASSWLNSHPYAYEMFKTYYAYSSYYGYNEVYELQVNYANSDYTNPTDVYNYDTSEPASALGF